MLRRSWTEAYSVPSEMIFSLTLTLSLNFNNVKKSEHFLAWETLCNKKICIEFILSFQISKHLVYNVWVWTSSKYTWPLYLRSHFNSTTIYWKLLALVKYCLYLQILWECCKCLILENPTFYIHYCHFLKQNSLGS